MKIKPTELQKALKRKIPTFIWISGNEETLLLESNSIARECLQEAGFTQREVFFIDNGFDWNKYHNAAGNLSLFSDKKLLELRFTSAKFDDRTKSALREKLQDQDPDIVFLINSPRIEASVLKTKWFLSIESRGLLVQVWPFKKNEFHTWLKNSFLKHDIKFTNEAVSVLGDRVEGNLLAASQEVEKLALLKDSDPAFICDEQTVLDSVASNSRYSVYSMVDAALQGDSTRSQLMLHNLQVEGIAPLLIVNAIVRELRTLLPILDHCTRGATVSTAIESAKIWRSRQHLIRAALTRLNTEKIWLLLEKAKVIDHAIKGINDKDPWIQLSFLFITLCESRKNF
tara:strand:+ start:2200 stop:3225 length:1026 start_codon:yes stop_codon:yes gene_type:complete